MGFKYIHVRTRRLTARDTLLEHQRQLTETYLRLSGFRNRVFNAFEVMGEFVLPTQPISMKSLDML